MSNKRIRIGFIGLNPDGGWASAAHIPVLKSLSDDFEIIGVANSTFESSKAAASALEIPLAFQNVQELVQSPEVDLVAITVKVPHHFELAKLAMEAGKHVYCEHPLGNGLGETRRLAEIAEENGVIAVVGTQFVVAPEILYLKQLVAEGYVGRVLSTSLIGSGIFWTDQAPQSFSYTLDKNNGATLLTIALGHTLSGFTEVLGNFEEVTARLLNNYNTVKIIETGDVVPKTAEDQILVIGKLESGAAASIHYRSGLSRGTNFLWEINGTEGDIQITAGNGFAQSASLTILGASGEQKTLEPLSLPSSLTDGLPDSSMIRNITVMYQKVAEDIRNGTSMAPSFRSTVQLHEFFEKIEKASQSNN